METKDYDEKVFSILIRVLKDAGKFKNYSKEYIKWACYSSRDKYKTDEKPEENILYWYHDIGERNKFFGLLYKSRLFNSTVLEEIEKRTDYSSHFASFCIDLSEDLFYMKKDEIEPEQLMYFYELEDTFSKFEKIIGWRLSPEIKLRWEKTREKWHSLINVTS